MTSKRFPPYRKIGHGPHSKHPPIQLEEEFCVEPVISYYPSYYMLHSMKATVVTQQFLRHSLYSSVESQLKLQTYSFPQQSLTDDL